MNREEPLVSTESNKSSTMMMDSAAEVASGVKDNQDENSDDDDYDEDEEIDFRTELGRVLPVDQILSGAANAAKFFSWGGQVLAKSASDTAEQVKSNPNVQEAVNRLKPGIDKLSEGATRVGGSIREESAKLFHDAPDRLGVLREGAVSGFVHVGQAVERVVGNVTAAGVAGGLSSAYCGMSRNEDVDEQEEQEIDQTYDFVTHPHSNTAAGANSTDFGGMRKTNEDRTADEYDDDVDVDADEVDVDEDNDDWKYDDDDDVSNVQGDIATTQQEVALLPTV